MPDNITQIVITLMITTIVSTAMGYFISKFKKILIEVGALKNGLKSILRDRITQLCSYSLEKKHIDMDRRDNLQNMLSDYKKLEVNHETISALVNQVMALPFNNIPQ